MSIQDLQDTLRVRADAVDDSGLAGRATAARRRAVIIRRRRNLALMVAAATIALPLAWLASGSANPFDRSAPVVTPPDHAPSDAFVESFGGRTLIDSEVVTGESEMVFAAPVSRNTEWRAICRSVGGAYTLHMSMDGGAPGELPCDVEQLTGRLIAYQLGPEYPVQGEHTLRIWLTRNSDAALMAPPDGQLGAAVYRLPDPVATVAGHQIQELEVDAGAEFFCADGGAARDGGDGFGSARDCERAGGRGR